MKCKPFGDTALSPIIAIVNPDDHREIVAVPLTIVSTSLIGILQVIGCPPPPTWSTFDYLFTNGMLAIVPWAKDCLKLENRIVSVDVEEEDEEVDQGTWKRRKMEKVTTSLPYLEK